MSTSTVKSGAPKTESQLAMEKLIAMRKSLLDGIQFEMLNLSINAGIDPTKMAKSGSTKGDGSVFDKFVEMVDPENIRKKHKDDGDYETIDQMEEIAAGILQRAVTGKDNGAAFRKSLLSDNSKIGDRITDLIISALYAVKAMGAEEKLKALKIDNLPLPDPDKIKEACDVEPELAPMSDGIHAILVLIKKVVDLLRTGDGDKAIDLILENIPKIKATEGFSEIIKRISEKAFAASSKLVAIEGEIINSSPDKTQKKPSGKKPEKKQADPVTVSQGADKAAACTFIPVPDTDSKPIFTTPAGIEPEPKDTVPEFIQDTKIPKAPAPRVPVTPDPVPTPVAPPLAEMPEAIQRMAKKNPWINEVIAIGASCGYVVTATYLTGTDNQCKAIIFMASRNGSLVSDRSFEVDLGQVITREYILWHVFTDAGTVLPMENAKFALHLFKTGGKDSGINEEMIRKIFLVGLNSFSEEDIRRWQAYGPRRLTSNQTICLISMPRIKDQQKRRSVEAALMRAAKVIRTSPEYGGLRFEVTSFDQDTLEIGLSSEGVPTYFMGQEPDPNRTDYAGVLKPARNNKGDVILIGDGPDKGKIAYEATFSIAK